MFQFVIYAVCFEIRYEKKTKLLIVENYVRIRRNCESEMSLIKKMFVIKI